MIKLPKNIKDFNLTNKEYMALSVEERNLLNEKLKTNIWDYYSEANPSIKKPELPCIIEGIIIGE